jgi:hypothetical protein
MLTNLRLIHTTHSEDYSDSEAQQLRDYVATAPGVVAVTDIRRHSRGGYSVSFDGRSDLFDAVIEHLAAAGYSGVL